MIVIMFKKNPEKLFQKAVKHWTSAKHEIYDWGGINWVNHGYQNALDECDKILDILYEKGDESKPEYYQSTKRGESDVKYHFDNLTQKTHWFKGFLLAYPFLRREILDHGSFKNAMLEFDKTIQINPENPDMWMIKVHHFLRYYIKKNEADGQVHEELWVEIIKCCDKVLSIDKDHLDAWDNKRWATGELERWEDEIECNNNVLRLDNRKEKRIAALGLNSECFKNLGRLSEAEKSLLEIQKIDPYNEMALEGLQKLSQDEIQQQLGKIKKTVEKLREIAGDGNQIPNDIEIKKINSSSLEMSMSCEKCGSTLKPTAKFCGKCGTPIAYNVQI